MAYTFHSLSSVDFEDLVRDLIGRKLRVRFEGFAAGPDEGMDGRHATATGTIVLQAKHYAGSPYAALKSKMKCERSSIDQLSPSRYILATSRPLSPANKRELAKIIGPSLRTEADIFGPGDLNSLLIEFPEIEQGYVKLWLTGTAVLNRIYRSAAHTFNKITKEEIEEKIELYAPNLSFDLARQKLEGQHVVIISGPPGVGKTTLAEMLSYAYMGDGWGLEAIRSLDDGMSAINDKRKQIFYFDDFLGKVALDRKALSHKDSDLAHFIRRIRKSANARFILTTRAHIFEEARQISEYFADPLLNISKYVLDVGVYTRRVKARILYNHLWLAGMPAPYIKALVESGDIPKIVDHKNYNPRIIEWMTDVIHLRGIAAADYPQTFLDTLAHPHRLWDIAFREHIPRKCQHLLFVIFFSSEWGVEISDLRSIYHSVHAHLCEKYGIAYNHRDFEDDLRSLESGFINVVNTTVTLINPSLRDYLTDYLHDPHLLIDLAAGARNSRWVQSLWEHGQALKLPPKQLRLFALTFFEAATNFPSIGRTDVLTRIELSHTDRLRLLMQWAIASDDDRFAELALALARKPIDGLDTWRDGDEAVDLVGGIRQGYYDDLECAIEIADHFEGAVIDMIETDMPLDELESISDKVFEYRRDLSADTLDAMERASKEAIENIGEAAAECDSDGTLQEYMEQIEKIGKRVSATSRELERAYEKINDRIAELAEGVSVSPSPSLKKAAPSEADSFDDSALKNLFATLVEKQSG